MSIIPPPPPSLRVQIVSLAIATAVLAALIVGFDLYNVIVMGVR